MKILRNPQLLISILAFGLISFAAKAQEFTAGINTETPNPNAVLHLVSPGNDQGLLVPIITDRVTMGAGLNAADEGLLIYDSTADSFFFWSGNAWIGLNVPANIADGIDWTEITGIPANIDEDDTDDVTLAAFPNLDTDNTDDVTLAAFPNLDTDATNDLTNTATPTGGDVSGDYATGLIVNTVGGETSANIAAAATLVNANPNIDTDDTDDVTLAAFPNLDTDNTDDVTLAAFPNLDTDATNDLTNTATPTGGDVSGDYATGLIVNTVGGETSANIAAAATLVNANPNIDTDDTDDVTLAAFPNLDTDNTDDVTLAAFPNLDTDATNDLTNTATPTGGDVSGDYATGLIVNTVGGETSANIAAAATLVNANPNIDTDDTDDVTLAAFPNLDTDNTDDVTLAAFPNLDTDATNDLTNTATPTGGDVSGDYATGLIVNTVGGETSANIAAAATLVNANPNIDTDDTDDVTLAAFPNLDTDNTDDVTLAAFPNLDTDATNDLTNTATPTGGDVSGDYATGLIVNTVGGETSANIAAAATLVNANPNIDTDDTDDVTLAAFPNLDTDNTDDVTLAAFPNLDTDATNDLTNTATPTGGDVSGDYATGLIVNTVGGETSANIAAAATLVNANPNIDTDDTDDVTLAAFPNLDTDNTDDVTLAAFPNLDTDATNDLTNTATPTGGDVSGDYATGLIVNTVGGETSANIAAAATLVNANPNIDTDDTDDVTLAAFPNLDTDNTDDVTLAAFPNLDTDATNDLTNTATPTGGDVSGDYATGLIVNTVGGETSANIAAAATLVNANPNIDTDDTDDVTLAAFPNLDTDNTDDVTLAAFPNLDTDATNDLTNTATPTGGDVSGDYATGLIVNTVGGETSANIAAAATLVNANPNIDTDDTDDVTLAAFPNLDTDNTDDVTLAAFPNLDTDATNDLTNTATPTGGDVSGDYATGLIVNTVGGETSANIAAAATLVNANPNIDTDDTDDVTLAAFPNLDTDNTDDVTLAAFPNLDTDATNDLTNTATPTGGDVSGDYATGLIVNTVGGETSANIAAAATLVNANPNIDTDDTDDVTLAAFPNLDTDNTDDVTLAAFPNLDTDATNDLTNTATPTGGDVSGDFATGLIVNTVGGETSANIAAAATLVNANPNIDTDDTDDGDMFAATYDPNTIIGDAFDMSIHTTAIAPNPGEVLEWDGANWNPAIDDTGGDMFAATYDPNTIVGDAFDMSIHTTAIAPNPGEVLEWDGANWNPAIDDTGGDMFAATYDPNTIVGDAFDMSIHTTAIAPNPGEVLEWDGANWNPAIDDTGGDMFAATYDPNTIVGDAFDMSIHTTAIAPNPGEVLEWDGANWNPAIDDTGGDMFAATYDPNTIVGDAFDMSIHTTAIAPNPGEVLEWDGANWNPAIDDTGGDMFAATYDPNTIVGDAFDMSIHTTAIAPNPGEVLEWDGANWNPAIDDTGGDMFAATYDPNTIVGDAFDMSIHTTAIAPNPGEVLEWDGANWNPAIDDTGGDMFAATYDPNTIVGDAFDMSIHTTVTAPIDGDVLTWDNTNGRWDAIAPPGIVFPVSETTAAAGPIFAIDHSGGGITMDVQNNSALQGDYVIKGEALNNSIAGYFVNNNGGATNQALYAHTRGSAPSLIAFGFGTGPAARISVNSAPGNASFALQADNDEDGGAAEFTVTNGSNSTPAVEIEHQGTGLALQVISGGVDLGANTLNSSGSITAGTFTGDGSALTNMNTNTSLSFNAPGDGDILTWDNTNSRWDASVPGALTPWTGSPDISYTGGNVGIGTITPLSALQIGDNLNVFHFDNGAGIAGEVFADNIYPNGNDLEYTTNKRASFLFLSEGGASLLSTGATPGTAGNSAFGNIGSLLELDSLGNGEVRGSWIVGSNQAIDEEQGMIQWTGSDFEGNVDGSPGGWVSLTAGGGGGDFVIDPNENSTGTNIANAPTGINNVVIGLDALLTANSGDNNVVIGHNADILDGASNGNVVIGNAAEGSSANTVAIGDNAQAVAANAIAIGAGAQANNPQAVAIGSNVTASIANTIVLGDGTPVYNVGINTDNPASTLDVNGDIRAGTGLNIAGALNVDNFGQTTITSPASGNLLELNHNAGSGSALEVNMNGSGNTGIRFNNIGGNALNVEAGLLTIDGNGNMDAANVAINNGGSLRIEGDGSGIAGGEGMIELQDAQAAASTIQIKALDNVPGDYTLTLPPDDGDANEVLSTDGNGNLTWEPGGGASPWTGSPDISYIGGNVGIGLASPSRELHLNGTGGISFQMTNGASAGTGVNNGFVIDYNDSDQTVDFRHFEGEDIAFGDGVRNLYIDNANNRVGIGNESPAGALDVEVGVGSAHVRATSNVTSGILQVRQDGTGDASVRFNMAGQLTTIGKDATDNNFEINMGSAIGATTSDFEINPAGDVSMENDLSVGGQTSTSTLNVDQSATFTGNVISAVTGPVNDGFTPASRIISVAAGATIDNITPGTVGQEIILITEADAIFNESSTIDLVTGSFNPTNARSTLHLVFFGTRWVEISRKDNIP